MKQIYKMTFTNYATEVKITETVAAERASRARSNFIRRMRYHGYLEKDEPYSVEIWMDYGERQPEQLTMEV